MALLAPALMQPIKVSRNLSGFSTAIDGTTESAIASREITKPRIDFFPGRDVFQNVSYATSRAHRNRVT